VIHSIQVFTGIPSQNRDTLNQGILETSFDGSSFSEVCQFEKGKAVFTSEAPLTLQAIRIRPTDSQNTWVAISEIVLS